jgi:hypothetical protein
MPEVCDPCPGVTILNNYLRYLLVCNQPVMKRKTLEATVDPSPQPSKVGASNAAPVPAATTTGVSETVDCINAVWPGYKQPVGAITTG